MGFVDMNPGQLLGTIILIGLFAVTYPTLTQFTDVIVQNSSGITKYLAEFIVPGIMIAILANLWGADENPQQ